MKMTKKEYVEKFLSPAVVAAETGIKMVEYVTNNKSYVDSVGKFHYLEELVVVYNNDYVDIVNVEMDSLSAMFYDFARRIF